MCSTLFAGRRRSASTSRNVRRRSKDKFWKGFTVAFERRMVMCTNQEDTSQRGQLFNDDWTLLSDRLTFVRTLRSEPSEMAKVLDGEILLEKNGSKAKLASATICEPRAPSLASSTLVREEMLAGHVVDKIVIRDQSVVHHLTINIGTTTEKQQQQQSVSSSQHL